MVLAITSTLPWNDQRDQKKPSLVLPWTSELRDATETLPYNLSKWDGSTKFLEGLKVRVSLGLWIFLLEGLLCFENLTSN